MLIVSLISTARKDENKTDTQPEIQENAQSPEPIPTPEPDARVDTLRDYLTEQGSPLADQSELLVSCADTHGINPYLLPGITAIESTYGKRACGGNPFGWASCTIPFATLEDSCSAVAEGISAKPYYSRYRQTGRIEDLGNVYCPANSGCNTPHWVATVQGVVSLLEEEEFVRAMDDLTKFLPADKSREELMKNIELLKKRLEKASETSKEVIEILIRANKRALEKQNE